MRQVVLLSGKGGTGKTSITAALAHLASASGPVVMADADVDGANLELLLDPQPVESHPFMGGQVAVIDADRCTCCGLCEEVCRFAAVVESAEGYRVDASACEGCASCFHQCPDGAIRMVPEQAGSWFRSETRFGPLLHASLLPGRENTGKLVSEVREQARRVSVETGAGLVLVDGPPGVGCPSIAASTGVDAAVVVTEPTASGIHDLERIVAMVDHFRIPALVLLNKADVNPTLAAAVAAFCRERDLPLVGEVPFDTVVTEAMVSGVPVTVHQAQGPVAAALAAAWERIDEALTASRPAVAG